MFCPYLLRIEGPEAAWEGYAKSDVSPVTFSEASPKSQTQMPFAQLLDVYTIVSSFAGHPSSPWAP